MNNSNYDSNYKFNDLVTFISKFQVQEAIINEKELETKLSEYLRTNYTIHRQSRIKKYRNDITVDFGDSKICLELKVTAGITCCKQIDNYIPFFKSGIIIVCWKATSNLKETLALVKSKIKQPIELIEIRRNQSLI